MSILRLILDRPEIPTAIALGFVAAYVVYRRERDFAVALHKGYSTGSSLYQPLKFLRELYQRWRSPPRRVEEGYF